ncbi:nucleotidyltransferase domain-containing protein [Desulfosarcina sp. OttesenSCG-928-A07]|nr:nucleotidyltransferase domain-containing protein [Desulfosarcina sp. OttesenSCG-928-G17]MDL2328650.1 nucleotidyltransferase domain-containing protein [Desulfosarcina sp. OttesenSCG-928-A07]
MICVSPDELATIIAILKAHVPFCEVRAFGSRQKRTNRDYSDLDLAVVGSEKLPRSLMADLREAFMESELPYRVDLVDYHGVSKAFQAIIDASNEIVFNGAGLAPPPFSST